MEVYTQFDVPKFLVADAQALRMMLQVYQLATQGAAFPIDILFRPWSNRAGQLSLIRQVIQAPSHVFSFLNSPRTLRSEAGPQGAPWYASCILKSHCMCECMCMYCECCDYTLC